MANLLMTYALLGYLKETSESSVSLIELYVPLVKKALADYSNEHVLSEYKGRSLSEISDKIKSIFEIEIPIPILSKIMSSICDEINNDNLFALYSDGSFIIKSFVFNDINDVINHEQDSIQILKDDYCTYCSENGFDCDFEKLKSFILSSQIDIFTNNQSGFLDVDYYIPKYINERLSDPVVFKIVSNIYLGGIIVSYIEQNITKQVTDAELLLDTNFIISLMDLNTEDAFQTCNQLFTLCKNLGYRFTILNSTINQIRILLGKRINEFASKDYIGSVRGADVFNACIRRGLDKTSLERIKDNILKTIQDKGIVIIHDAQIRDIVDRARKSPNYKVFFERRKNEESAMNDTVAELYVEKKRGDNIREFVDVKCWFLHNSFSPYDYSIGRKIHERYLISANELLVLLWLSSPAQGKNIKITDLARSGLTAYVTKYRRAKAPSHEVLRCIKKRIDDVSRLGAITEKDTFNLCIRMAEGHLTHSEVVESLLEPSVTDEQFANKLLYFTQEEEAIKQKQKQKFAEEKSQLQEQLNKQNAEMNELRETMAEILKQQYIQNRKEYVEYEIKKIRKETFFAFLLFLIITTLWSVNEFWGNLLPTIWSSIISLTVFVVTTFGMLFFNEISVRDFFCRRDLRARLEKKYDDMNK